MVVGRMDLDNTSEQSGGVRLLAVYLPQFHPIAENDEWWGKGFTEWRNVAKAKALFRSHYQPHIPADLGFYDLRLSETREAQAALARSHGIYGFCYYHYWFKGRRILERPFNEVLSSRKPDFPFCLFWANDTWEGRWHGITNDQKVLIKQEYSQEDDLSHFRWLASVMADPRYIKVSERPVFVVFRPTDLPDPRRTVELWREEAVRLGIHDPYLVASDSHAVGPDLTALGFDAVLQYLPQLGVLDCFRGKNWRHKLRRFALNLCQGILSTELHVYDYEEAVRNMLRDVPWDTHKCIMPGWDNSPRSGKHGVILKDGTPEKFERILESLCQDTVIRLPPDRRMVFINAWNEWAEGNHLEPDLRFGRQYLEAIKRVATKFTSGTNGSDRCH